MTLKLSKSALLIAALGTAVVLAAPGPAQAANHIIADRSDTARTVYAPSYKPVIKKPVHAQHTRSRAGGIKHSSHRHHRPSTADKVKTILLKKLF